MRISTHEELLQVAEKHSGIIIYGKSTLIRTVLRFWARESRIPSMKGICYTDTKKKQKVFEVPVKSLNKMANDQAETLVLVAVTSEKKKRLHYRSLSVKGIVMLYVLIMIYCRQSAAANMFILILSV